MSKQQWTSTDIKKMYRFEDRGKPIQSLYSAEERGVIPKAGRMQRGKVSARVWDISQIPQIGLKLGFLKPPNRPVVISKYMPKGGVLKTTTTYNEAKTFALHGFNTIIIGLDSECSITGVVAPQKEISVLDEKEDRLGLYDFFVENASIDDVIMSTDLPTLDIIPESHALVALDKWLNHVTRKEYCFLDKLLPLLSSYDVVIFDNCPNWNNLIENSITASNIILSPLGCNLLAYDSSRTNIESIFDFQRQMNLDSQKVIMFPTLLGRGGLSHQIYSRYLEAFTDYIIEVPIRASIKGEEALVADETIFEYAPSSSLAQDYYHLLMEIWSRINGDDLKVGGDPALTAAETL